MEKRGTKRAFLCRMLCKRVKVIAQKPPNLY
jgi:hypothetical protein